MTLCMTRNIFFALGAFWAMCTTKPARMQLRMWRTIELWLLLKIGSSVVLVICEFVNGGCMDVRIADSSSALVSGIALFVVRQHHWRQWAQARLGRMFEARGATMASAGIASLLGSCSVEDALAQAKPRFRRVRFGSILKTDLITTPTPQSLHERTEHADLGDCDAFISQSWHDDLDAKWAALQTWFNAFFEERGREPHVWLDKFCINQNDIAADLRGLPIFLRGCNEMLVCFGPTYLSRLWCVVELFVFVHMGSDASSLTVLPLLRVGQEDEDAALLRDSISNFDAQQCDCVVRADKDAMLHIVHTAFGDLSSFNVAVRAILAETRMMERVPSALASDNVLSTPASLADVSDD